MMEVRRVRAWQGWRWISEGYALFRQNPVIWIALFFIYVLIAMGLSIVPLLGPIVLNLLAPVFMAGFMIGCRAMEEGEELEINHLFAGFRVHAARLVTVGGLYLCGVVVIVGVVFVVTGSATLLGADMEREFGEHPSQFLPVMLGVLAALVPLVMAYWFAPALVVFQNATPREAMRQSFAACGRNMMPFLVYGVASMVLMLLAIIPLGLGLLVMIPTFTASLYASYRDIFGRPAALPVAGEDNV